VPTSQVVGVVDRYVPVVGYLLAMMSLPSGIVSVISMLAALLIATWIIDDQEAEERAAREEQAPSPPRMRELPA